MFAEFKHALRRSKGQIFGWGIALFLLVVLLVSLYEILLLYAGYPRYPWGDGGQRNVVK